MTIRQFRACDPVRNAESRRSSLLTNTDARQGPGVRGMLLQLGDLVLRVHSDNSQTVHSEGLEPGTLCLSTWPSELQAVMGTVAFSTDINTRPSGCCLDVKPPDATGFGIKSFPGKSTCRKYSYRLWDTTEENGHLIL